jgi:uncharacterized protein YjdB
METYKQNCIIGEKAGNKMDGKVLIFKKRTSLLKALVTVVITVLLTASMLPAQALAKEPAPEEWTGGFTYYIGGDSPVSYAPYGYGVYITGLATESESLKSVTIPAQIDGIDVVYAFLLDNISSLDVSKCVKLKYLWCSKDEWGANKQLASLDLSKNTALEFLDCSGNQLASLDVSKNTALVDLHCSDNQLTSLDISKNTALESLSCINNQLTSLDISKHTALGWLRCENNYIADTSKLDAWLAKHPDGGQVQPQKPIKVTSIKTQSTLTLVKGKTATLPATVSTQPSLPVGAKVTFKSSKPKIATVNKTTGKIKALKAGKTTITVTSTDGKKTAKCVVTVVAKTTKIKTLKAFKPVGLLVGKTTQVKPKITPAKATGIIYKDSSSKKSVATIDKAGVITALKKGVTTITVKAGTKTQKFKVTVGTVLPAKITLSKKSVSIKAKATTKLTVKWSPTKVDPKTVTWTSSNKRVATVDKNGKVKGVKKGKCTITATTWNGKTVKCSVTVR